MTFSIQIQGIEMVVTNSLALVYFIKILYFFHAYSVTCMQFKNPLNFCEVCRAQANFYKVGKLSNLNHFLCLFLKKLLLENIFLQ